MLTSVPFFEIARAIREVAKAIHELAISVRSLGKEV